MTLKHPPEFVEKAVYLAQPDPMHWLIEVTDPDGGPLLSPGGKQITPRVTPNTTEVTFGGKTYEPLPMKIGRLRRGSDGGAASIPVTISAAAGELMALLDANDYLRDHRVEMLLVHSTLLGDPSAKVTVRGTVTSLAVNWTAITLNVSAYDDLNFDVPKPLCDTKCTWTYRGKGCDFTGDPGNVELGRCAKTLTACKARGQWQVDNGVVPTLADADYPLFFGGLPAIPVGVF